MPDFYGPGGPRASERLYPDLLQVEKALRIIRSHLPIQVQRGACQADGAQRLPAHLRHAGKHVLDSRTCFGDAAIASLLCIGDWFVLAALALDVHPPALLAQSSFTLAVDISFVGQDVPVRVDSVEHVLEMLGVVFAGRAHLDLAYQLVAFVGVDRDLVAEIGLAVFFVQRASMSL